MRGFVLFVVLRSPNCRPSGVLVAGDLYHYAEERTLHRMSTRDAWRGRCGAALGEISRIPGGDGPVEFSERAAVCFCGKHSWEPEATCAWGMSAGGLCSELHKDGGALAKKSAALFTEPIGWLEEQFRAAGHEEDARELSAHLFCAFQGMAAVAHAANDPDLVVMEVKRLKDWIGTL